MNATAEQIQSTEDMFGPVISSYSRAQAIEDGVLVDISEAEGCKGHFKFPVAMTRAAWAAAVEAGGTWQAGPDDGHGEQLTLSGGQSVAGRLHDVCWMLKCAIRRGAGGNRADFSVLVNQCGNGKHKRVELYSLCGPGDNMEPVITIMLPNED